MAVTIEATKFISEEEEEGRPMRFDDARYEDSLEACFLYKKTLADNFDLFMHRGDVVTFTNSILIQGLS